MNEMIERVGAALRAACLKEFGSNWNNDVAWAFAHAAIEAMREPTIEMQVAGTEQWLCVAAMEDRSAANWRAMIDAILTGEHP